MLKRTPFHDFHVAAGAKLVDFAGWEMPILYRGIVEEHEQTRNSGSLFDVSHMGRLYLTGKDATKFLDHVLTRNVAQQKVGQSRYSLVCNESGGVIDDVIVSRDETHWLVVCNASNRDRVVRHFEAARQGRGGFDVRIDDRTVNGSEWTAAAPLLYHVNLGAPLWDGDAFVESDAQAVAPRDDDAAAGLETWDVPPEPAPDAAERVFEHVGASWARLTSPRLGIELTVRSSLPRLWQWVHPTAGTNALATKLQ